MRLLWDKGGVHWIWWSFSLVTSEYLSYYHCLSVYIEGTEEELFGTFINQHNCLLIRSLPHRSRHLSSPSVNDEPYAHSCADNSLWYTSERYQLALLHWSVRMCNHGYSSYLNVSPKLPLVGMGTSFATVLMHFRKLSTTPSFILSVAHRVFKTLFLQQWPSTPQWRFVKGTSIASFMTDSKDLKCDHHTLCGGHIATYIDGFKPPVTEG